MIIIIYLLLNVPVPVECCLLSNTHAYAAELFMLKVTCSIQAVFNKGVSLKFSIVSFIHVCLIHSIITHFNLDIVLTKIQQGYLFLTDTWP